MSHQGQLCRADELGEDVGAVRSWHSAFHGWPLVVSSLFRVTHAAKSEAPCTGTEQERHWDGSDRGVTAATSLGGSQGREGGAGQGLSPQPCWDGEGCGDVATSSPTQHLLLASLRLCLCLSPLLGSPEPAPWLLSLSLLQKKNSDIVLMCAMTKEAHASKSLKTSHVDISCWKPNILNALVG